MRALASFVSSTEGQVYARTHARWGTDPAAFLEAEDDVLAYNLRVALLTRLERPEPEIDEHAAGVERAKAGGRAIREAVGG